MTIFEASWFLLVAIALTPTAIVILLGLLRANAKRIGKKKYWDSRISPLQSGSLDRQPSWRRPQ